MDPSSLPLSIQEYLAAQNVHWKQVTGAPSADLLRLGILRELSRFVHAERSSVLSRGDRGAAQSLLVWENAINELRKATMLPEDLLATLADPEKVRRRTRLLPDTLFDVIRKDKLERHDRAWEAAISAEACAQGWGFWSLASWVPVPAVEDWTKRLLEHLWPYGLLLFTESMGFLEHPTGQASEALWNGRWILVLEGRFATPADLSMNISHWPGTPPNPPEPPQWKLLFSPKKR